MGLRDRAYRQRHQYTPKNIDDLVEITEGSFADLDSMKLDNVFLSYHLAMESAMIVEVGNNYKLQHIGKAKLRREGCLHIVIRWSDKALDISDAHLRVDTERVVRFIEDGMEELRDSMDHLFLSDEDSTYAAVNKLEPLQLIE